MKYEIIEKSWSKRRKLDAVKKISNIEFIDFVKQHDHFCKMHVTYSDGSENTFISRVVYNDINNNWTIDGMHVAVRLLD